MNVADEMTRRADAPRRTPETFARNGSVTAERRFEL